MPVQASKVSQSLKDDKDLKNWISKAMHQNIQCDEGKNDTDNTCAKICKEDKTILCCLFVPLWLVQRSQFVVARHSAFGECLLKWVTVAACHAFYQNLSHNVPSFQSLPCELLVCVQSQMRHMLLLFHHSWCAVLDGGWIAWFVKTDWTRTNLWNFKQVFWLDPVHVNCFFWCFKSCSILISNAVFSFKL